MKIDEINSIFRNKIQNLINDGWLKTHIGKVLLGSNGQAHLNHFLKENKETGQFNDFGIKPLQRIANTIDFDVHVAFIPKGEHETKEHLSTINLHFLEELMDALLNYLDNNVNANHTINQRQSRTQIDNVLDDILPVSLIED